MYTKWYYTLIFLSIWWFTTIRDGHMFIFVLWTLRWKFHSSLNGSIVMADSRWYSKHAGRLVWAVIEDWVNMTVGSQQRQSQMHLCHNDVMTRKHFQHYWPFVQGMHWSDMEILPALLALRAGKPPVRQRNTSCITGPLCREIHQSDTEVLPALLALRAGNPPVRHGNTSCITGPLCRESASHRWIPSTKGQ